jgi:biotin carboxylase
MTETPRLAVFHDQVSLSIFEVFEAARDLCRVVWIVGWSADEPTQRGLARFGEVVDLSGVSETEFVDRIAAARPDGVVIFHDAPLMLAAAVAERIQVPFHSPHTALLLSDKLAQRIALRQGGLPVPAYTAMQSGEFAAGDVPFPAVLKPRAGAGSRDTYRIESATQGAEAWAKCDPDEAFILEELLADRSTKPGLGADQISVESIVRQGEIEHLTVTGRFPMAPPFRETGAYLPSDLGPDEWGAVFDLASRAMKALGVSHGILHTEIKMTPDGPRIIEVNGRLGGSISGLVSRLGGPSLFVVAMKLALGQPMDPIPVITGSPIAFYRLLVAPPLAVQVETVVGVEDLHDVPGVDNVQVNRRPGDPVDSRMMTQLDHVVRIDGMVESHDELNELVHGLINATVSMTFIDENGERTPK